MVDESKPALRPAITHWDLWLGGAAFGFAMVIGGMLVFAEPIVSWFGQHAIIASLVVALSSYVLLIDRRSRRGSLRLLRALGDRVGVGEPQLLLQPRVVDGDTIEDAATSVRYRLANIDAPETGENAKCFHERRVGEWAASVANKLMSGAGVVSVRRTRRVDRYGRTVAYVFLDGADLGDLLTARGLARRWHGKRRPWCGANGPLAKLAALRGERHPCTACTSWPRKWR